MSLSLSHFLSLSLSLSLVLFLFSFRPTQHLNAPQTVKVSSEPGFLLFSSFLSFCSSCSYRTFTRHIWFIYTLCPWYGFHCIICSNLQSQLYPGPSDDETGDCPRMPPLMGMTKCVFGQPIESTVSSLRTDTLMHTFY